METFLNNLPGPLKRDIKTGEEDFYVKNCARIQLASQWLSEILNSLSKKELELLQPLLPSKFNRYNVNMFLDSFWNLDDKDFYSYCGKDYQLAIDLNRQPGTNSNNPSNPVVRGFTLFNSKSNKLNDVKFGRDIRFRVLLDGIHLVVGFDFVLDIIYLKGWKSIENKIINIHGGEIIRTLAGSEFTFDKNSNLTQRGARELSSSIKKKTAIFFGLLGLGGTFEEFHVSDTSYLVDISPE